MVTMKNIVIIAFAVSLCVHVLDFQVLFHIFIRDFFVFFVSALSKRSSISLRIYVKNFDIKCDRELC